MTNWGFEDDETTPKGLRDWAEATKEENKLLQTKLAAIEAQLKKATVGDTFENLGVSRSLATHYQGDADPEKISAWVNDVRTALGGAPAVPVVQAPAAPVLGSEAQAQYQQITEAGQGTVTNASTMDAWQAGVMNAQSVDDLHALWATIK